MLTLETCFLQVALLSSVGCPWKEPLLLFRLGRRLEVLFASERLVRAEDKLATNVFVDL